MATLTYFFAMTMTTIKTGNEPVNEFIINNGNIVLIISFVIFYMLFDIETMIYYFHKLSLIIDIVQ